MGEITVSHDGRPVSSLAFGRSPPDPDLGTCILSARYPCAEDYSHSRPGKGSFIAFTFRIKKRHGTTTRNVRCRLITEPQPWRGFLFSSQSGADFCTSTIPTRVAISAVMSTSWMPQNLPKWAKASEFGVSERITNGHPVQTVLCERAINWRKDSNQA